MNLFQSLVVIVSLLLSELIYADEAASKFFMGVYNAMCVQSGGRTEIITKILEGKGAPKLTPEQAQPFLQGKIGTAWPIVVSEGSFVLVATSDNMCSLFAKKADTKEVESFFSSFFTSFAKQPNIVMLKQDKNEKKVDGGVLTTISYLMTVGDAKDAFDIRLTTSTSTTSNVQALASIAMVKNSE